MEYMSLVVVTLFALACGFIYMIQGPPFVPTRDEVVKQIIEELKKLRPMKILDMGSGDGTLLIALAKAGYEVDGIELNPLLVRRSRRLIKKAGVNDKVKVRWGNFWNYDTSSYDVIVLYVIKHIMPHLEKKLLRELHKGSYIISNYFIFPNLKPIYEEGRMKVYKV